MGKANIRPEQKQDTDGKTKADRKFEKKMQFYQLVRGSVADKVISKEKQQKKRSRQKKLKAYDLSSLSENLPEIRDPSKSGPGEFKINNKTKNSLVLKESNQLNIVINHPVFKSDPLGAIYHHLQNTQPLTAEKPKRKDGKTRKHKSKKKSRSSESMEM